MDLSSSSSGSEDDEIATIPVDEERLYTVESFLPKASTSTDASLSADRSRGDESKVTIRFVTRLPMHMKVPETPFELPARVARRGLSEIVNHLLSLNEAVPFDFIDEEGRLLRTTLKAHVAATGGETSIVTLEYIRAMLSPELADDIPHEDWVASLDSAHGIVASGGFDCALRVYNGSGLLFSAQKQHTGTLQCVKILAPGVFMSGSKDCSASISICDETSKKWTLLQTMQLKTPVTAISQWSNSNRVVLGEARGLVSFYQYDTSVVEEAKSSASKKRKASVVSSHEAAAVHTVDGHQQRVVGINWVQEERLITASWDNSVREFDIGSGVAVNVRTTGGKTLTSLDVQPGGTGVCACGDASGIVRVMDLRDSSAEPPKLRSHKQWVSQVRFHPTRDNLLVSSSYDNSVKLWDVRGAVPLYTMDAGQVAGEVDPKQYACGWANESTIISGGTQAKIKRWNVVL